MAYEHLRFNREEPLNDRHRRQDRRPRPRPEDPRAFAVDLSRNLRESLVPTDEADVAGFDDRRLIKIEMRPGESQLPNFDSIQGIEVVSQESRSVVLAFATDEGLAEFEARLATLARDGTVRRSELLFAIEAFDHWTPADRTGNALRDRGFPNTDSFVLDIELWPQERTDRRERLVDRFLAWMTAEGIERLDDLSQPCLVMVRLRCDREQAGLLLRHRDVRTVDLPPRVGITIELLLTDTNAFPDVLEPPDAAPSICVLDTGITTGHPLLGAAVGDALGFVVPERTPEDNVPNGHGTFVGGIALYGDVAECIRQGQFVPVLRLYSGRVFQDDGADQPEFVEKAVEEAVREILETYGCRVFNLSYGDHNKVYDGRHLRGLAYTLDRLTRELGVLFVVPTGNLRDFPDDPVGRYPGFLADESSRLLDPATSLNALTVGGVAEGTATQAAQRYPNTLEDVPIAEAGQPSPFTRRGPSINGAIKPDVVEIAGNLAISRDGTRIRHNGLGIASLNSGFATGPAFAEDVGTSYAAPAVAHLAARLLADFPDASPNLLRAVLGAHARWPHACAELLNHHSNADGLAELLKVVGYGQINDRALLKSTEQTVTLLAEDQIGVDRHHFYVLPAPSDLWSPGRRLRDISIALAYSPEVRTTRIDYRASKLWFTFVTAGSLDEVSAAFRRNRDDGMGERSYRRSISNKNRGAGTLQVARWEFSEPIPERLQLYVVVTRQDSAWSQLKDDSEPYALAVVLSDQNNAEARLYAQTQVLLRARARIRVQP